MGTVRTVVTAFFFLGALSVAKAQSPELPVMSLGYETVPDEREFDAVVEAVNQSTVSAQTAGRITEINFDADDYVPKGAVLLRMRDTEQRATFSAAQARVREAQAEFDRTAELLKQQLVPKAAFDRAEAALKSATAALDQAKEQAGYTVVRAPYSGIVVERHVQVGESARPGQPLMTGLSLEALRVTAHVPQADIAAVRAVGKGWVLLPAGQRLASGTLTVSPYADPRSHTFKVKGPLTEGAAGIYPGMFVKMVFATGQTQRLMVPAQAVVNRSEITAVYVLKDDGRVFFRQVRTGAEYAGKVELLAGVSAGEKLILDPVRAGILLKEQRMGKRS